MEQYDNTMLIRFPAKSENEGLARVAVTAFAAPLDPTVSELTDMKTAVSEAVTNAIVHGYAKGTGDVEVFCQRKEETIYIMVSDKGCGISDITQAMEPLYTSKPEQERAGLGFTIMETFMDSLEVESKVGEGTCVKMAKKLSKLR